MQVKNLVCAALVAAAGMVVAGEAASPVTGCPEVVVEAPRATGEERVRQDVLAARRDGDSVNSHTSHKMC